MALLREDEEKLIDRISHAVVDRRLTVPAILVIESTKPLAFLGSQALHFFEPLLRVLVGRPEYQAATELLGDREKLELLLRRIETYEERRADQGAEDKKGKP